MFIAILQHKDTIVGASVSENPYEALANLKSHHLVYLEDRRHPLFRWHTVTLWQMPESILLIGPTSINKSLSAAEGGLPEKSVAQPKDALLIKKPKPKIELPTDPTSKPLDGLVDRLRSHYGIPAKEK